MQCCNPYVLREMRVLAVKHGLEPGIQTQGSQQLTEEL